MAIKDERFDPLPDSFLELPDTPDSYAGQAGKAVAVKPSEDGLEFVVKSSSPGIDIRSGVILNAVDGSFGIVQFAADPNNRFANIPQVVLTLHGNSLAIDILILSYVTTNGFEWNIFKGHGGASHTWNIHWIATDAGT